MPISVSLLNHASLRIDGPDGGLLSDPWYEGLAFGNGWRLLVQRSPSPGELDGVRWVWISHEHPDHFSPATLRKFFADRQEHVEILYQDTADERVVGYLRKQGYRVRVLPHGQFVDLGPHTRVLCRGVGTGDSYLVAVVDGTTWVNTNDAILLDSDLAMLRQDLADLGGVDVLTTQYGLAGKVGNTEDRAERLHEATQILGLVRRQVELARPTYFLPSASLKYFCRDDNWYMNDAHNSYGDVVRVLDGSRVVPVLLLPGETWALGSEPPPGEKQVDRYHKAVQSIEPVEVPEEQAVDPTTLLALGDDWVTRMRTHHSRLMLGALAASPVGYRLSPIAFRLTDSDLVLELGIRDGCRARSGEASARNVVSVSSPVLSQALREDFGFMTLFINARFQASPAAQRVLRTYALLGAKRAAGERVDVRWLRREAGRIVGWLRAGRVG